MADQIIYKDESYRIMGACFEVHNELGVGFVEPIYQAALEIELTLQGIPFVEQEELVLSYKGHRIEETYKPDFVCFELIILEIKAVRALVDKHRAQVLNYLKATGLKLGLLVNFSGHPKLEYERIAR